MYINPRKSLFIIDGSSFLYRAYYGIRPLHTSRGVPVQAVYSFCKMIKKLIDDFNAHYVVIVWDAPGKTVRHELYEAYKATRQEPPRDIFDQKNYIMQFADRVGIKQITCPGIEADDIMYSLAKQCEPATEHVVLISSDKDMAQALSSTIVVYDAWKHTFITPQTFADAYGFSADKVPFYYALVGDSSDNIPGVRGIGKKTATELVSIASSLDDLYTKLSTLKPRIAALLTEHKKDAFLSYDLFLLRQYPMDITLEDCCFSRANWHKAVPLLQELEFSSLLTIVGQTLQQRTDTVENKIAYWQQYDFRCITTLKDLQILCAQVYEATMCVVDTETAGPHPFFADLVGISIAYNDSVAYYIPCDHITTEPMLTKEIVIEHIKPILQDPAIKKYFHHAKYDMQVLAGQGIKVAGLVLDTLIAARLCTPEVQRIGLKSLSLTYFNEAMLSFDDVVKEQGYTSFKQVPLPLATLYACADVRQTYKLIPIFTKELVEKDLEGVYTTIEHPLITVLSDMEQEGIVVDVPCLQALASEVDSSLRRIETTIAHEIGLPDSGINLNSPRQVEQLLFSTLQLPPQKRSAKKTGYSTDAHVLSALSSLHPVPGLILQYRELAKLKTTYIEALPTFVQPSTGKIHTHFNQTNVATGRLSSSDPNLQNIPAAGYGLEVRNAFKPETGHRFMSADYSQIELRVLAFLAQDEQLIQAFLQGKDIHTDTASRLFNVPVDQVTHAQRQLGKRINFSVLYGLTPYGLSQELKISFSEAKSYITRYFQEYKTVAHWMDDVVAFAKQHEYVMTYAKRRRYIPAINERNHMLYQEAKRSAINSVVQGTAAEIMKLGMIKLHQALKDHALNARLVLQIHDELLLCVPEHEQAKVQSLVHATLQNVVAWPVPFVVTIRTGYTWKEVTK